MRRDGRADHIEDYLITVRLGQWFGWSDSKNKIYANLRLHDKVWNSDGSALIDNPVTELPTESVINTKLAEIQAAWDSRNAEYKLNRRKEYPSVVDQLDDIYHNGIDAWKATIKATKDKYPKP